MFSIRYIIIYLILSLSICQDTTLVISNLSIPITLDSKNPTVELFSPNGQENYNSFENIEVSWEANDLNFNSNPINLYISENIGSSFNILQENISNLESININLPEINTGYARIKIIAYDQYGNSNQDISDNYFTIGNYSNYNNIDSLLTLDFTYNNVTLDSKNPDLFLLSQINNETYDLNEPINIEWDAQDTNFDNSDISIYFSSSIGSFFEPILTDLENISQTSINLENNLSTNFGRIRIKAEDSFGNQNIVDSNHYLSIGYEDTFAYNDTTLMLNNNSYNLSLDSKNPNIDLIYPNGGEQFSDNQIIDTVWETDPDNSLGENPISIFMTNQIGGVFEPIAEAIPNTEVYELQLPESEDILTFSRLKVTAVDLFGNESEDYSNNYFAIALTPKFSASTTPEVAYLDQSNQSVQVEFNIDVTSPSLVPSLYEWDFNGDGDYDWSSTLNEPAYYSYSRAGEYAPRVRVTDSDDNTTTVQEIYVVVEEFDVDLAPVDEQVSINWGFGSIQTVLVDDAAIEFMNIGDQIHVVDNSGVVRGGCSHLDMLGTITVGSFTYEGQDDLVHPINCYKTYDNCDETGWYSWDYMNYGEVPEFVVYDASEDKYFEGLFTEATPTYRGMSHHILDSLYTGNEVFPNTDFDFLQSTSQSFYYIVNASVNGNPIENDDVIGAFREGICVGYRNWIGNYTDIPVMGNDGGRSYQGYVQDNPMQFLYYNVETDEYTELTPTFEYGQAIFGDETIKINSFDLIRNTETVNYSITESRDDKTYNIYKNQELLVSGISDNEYIDDSISLNGNYCYEIAIVENGNEIDMSEPQCIDVTLENQYPLGDINQDTYIDINDIILLIRIILNEESNPNADINQDNVVNVADVIHLVYLILNS